MSNDGEVRCNVDDSKLKIEKVHVEKVDVKTGEEDEEAIFTHRSKLYLFIKEDVYGGEKRENYWKERGLGDVKILKHKSTGKHRLLMRQEKTMKICCNHYIAPATEMTVHQDTEKACVFTTNDFAEGEVQENTYTMRFKTADIVRKFMDAYKAAQKTNAALAAEGGDAAPPAAPAENAAEDVPALVGQLMEQIRSSDWLEKQMAKTDAADGKKPILDLPSELLATVKGEDVAATADDAALASLLDGLAKLTTDDAGDAEAVEGAEKKQMPVEELEKLMNPLQKELVKMLDAKADK
jgi:Ran-binding protein 1